MAQNEGGPNSKKTVYDAFNKETKRLLKDMREVFPEQSKHFNMLLVVLKVTKHMGRKMPHRFFDELFHQPFAAHLRKNDEAFFLSPAFVVPSYEAFIHELQHKWTTTERTHKDRVWARVHELLDASDACLCLSSHQSRRGT